MALGHSKPKQHLKIALYVLHRPSLHKTELQDNFTLDPTSNEIASTTLIFKSFRSFGHT
jgi:hypothetical protein